MAVGSNGQSTGEPPAMNQFKVTVIKVCVCVSVFMCVHD